MLGRRTKRQVVHVATGEEYGVPLWMLTLECGHYVKVSKRKWHSHPTLWRCSICRHAKA